MDSSFNILTTDAPVSFTYCGKVKLPEGISLSYVFLVKAFDLTADLCRRLLNKNGPLALCFLLALFACRSTLDDLRPGKLRSISTLITRH